MLLKQNYGNVIIAEEDYEIRGNFCLAVFTLACILITIRGFTMMNQQREKNNSIEVFRILFTAVICIHHARGLVNANWLKHGYLCVEFFFIVSGYFLYKTFHAETQHDVFRFLCHRMRKLYPDYLLAEIIAICVFGIHAQKFTISSAVGELLMLQSSGLIGSSYNYPCWYMSALILGSVLLYGLLSIKKEAFTAFIGPTLILLVYTYLLHLPGGLEQWSCVGPVSLSLLRGCAGLSIGILIAAVQKDRHMLSSFVTIILEGIALVLIALGLLTNRSGEMLTVLAFAALVAAITCGESPINRLVSNCTFIPKLSRYCYPIYLNHAFSIKVLRFCCRKAGVSQPPILLFCVVVTVIGLMMHFIVVKAIGLAQRSRRSRAIP